MARAQALKKVRSGRNGEVPTGGAGGEHGLWGLSGIGFMTLGRILAL